MDRVVHIFCELLGDVCIQGFIFFSHLFFHSLIHGFLSILFLPLYFILSFFFSLLFLSSLLLLLPPLIYVLKLGVATDSLQQECMQCLDSQSLRRAENVD